MNSSQLSIFDQPTGTNLEIADSAIVDESCFGFEVGDRVQILNAGTPLDKYNRQKGEVVSIKPGLVSVQLEGLNNPIMFRYEALQKWTALSEYIDSCEEADLTNSIAVGNLIMCDYAFIGITGIVRQIGMSLGITVAWVDFGSGKPLYPCLLESLILAE
jgi:hypothetical protein